MALTQSLEEFINENDGIVILVVSSTVFKGIMVLKDGNSRRVELSDCICYVGGKEISLNKMTLKTEDIVGWGIPSK